MSIGKLGWWER